MEKPKCKICGQRHWGGCAPSAPTGKPTTTRPKSKPKPITSVVVAPHAARAIGVHQYNEPTLADLERVLREGLRLLQALRAKPSGDQGSFDKAAYQREYMRKRRATKKTT